MRRILLLLPTTGYRNDDFRAAAQSLGVEVIACANYCHELAPSWGMGPLLSVAFDRPQFGVEKTLAALGERRPEAVLAVDDLGLEFAAVLRQRLGLPGNSPAAIATLRDKLAFRRLLQANGFLCPKFHHLEQGVDAWDLVPELRWPVVVKPRRLSASRGVIRADSPEEFSRATEWVNAIQRRADRDAATLGLIVENFIPGTEYAVEGMLEGGRLRMLALFDKPDPLNGPHFEETIYVTPSRLPAPTQAEIAHNVERVCRLAGIGEGPIHAEVRLNDQGVWLLEAAARSIGGLCGRVLRHALGMSLEELILRTALGESPVLCMRTSACGVMMIPIPRRGVYQAVSNLEAARAQPYITDINITAEPGQLVAPPPEGASYLGFIFARGDRPEQVEYALRNAHKRLWFDISPEFLIAHQKTAARPSFNAS
jgi:biotin carboxylase